ncbi:amidase family protein (plasmid) [Klebsiella sp. B345]|uniref:amidase family protein n=1 Tax=Klebsiella sp. B345 TaxID=2755398 RepID=UPI003DA98E07
MTDNISDDTLLLGSARDMLRAMENGDISAEELLKLHWARVERFNPTLNLVVEQNRNTALADARRIDQARVNGGFPGVLAGLPMTIKDSFEVAGMVATCGMPQMSNHRPQIDAITVAHLRSAGAVIYGKTNVPYACGDHQSYNDIYGVSLNPWDPSCTPGGSSGASAAALASGLTALELGSDIGGSIRCPAHFCGVYGHKTTHGLLPAIGHMPPAPHSTARSELSVVGPLARTPGDLSLALDVLLGLHGGTSDPLPASRHICLEDFRVGLWLDAYPIDDEYRAAILRFADDLKHIGVQVDETARPDINPVHSNDIYMETLFGVIGSRMSAEALEMFTEQVSAASTAPYAEKLLRYVSNPAHLSPSILNARKYLGLMWQTFFHTYDLLICPVTPTVAFPHDHSGGHGPAAQLRRVLTVNGFQRPYLDNLQWPGLATVANLPATAMPSGHFVRGLPAGVQVIGPLGEDRTPLLFTELVAQRLQHKLYPTFSNL